MELLRETNLDEMFKYFNIFLKQCGFIRNNDYILPVDITEEEYDLLYDYLYQIRNKNNVEKEGKEYQKD